MRCINPLPLRWFLKDWLRFVWIFSLTILPRLAFNKGASSFVVFLDRIGCNQYVMFRAKSESQRKAGTPALGCKRLRYKNSVGPVVRKSKPRRTSLYRSKSSKIALVCAYRSKGASSYNKLRHCKLCQRVSKDCKWHRNARTSDPTVSWRQT